VRQKIWIEVKPKGRFQGVSLALLSAHKHTVKKKEGKERNQKFSGGVGRPILRKKERGEKRRLFGKGTKEKEGGN